MAKEQKTRSPFYKKWWFWVIAAVVLIGAIGASSESKDDNTNTTTNGSSSSQKADKKQPEAKKERTVTGEAATLGAGTFIVGSDIKVGLYDVAAGAGQSGNFITSGGGNEILGGEYGIQKLRIELKKDEEVKISGLSQVTFTPVTAAFVSAHVNTSLYTGTFIVGEDIGAGRYRVTPAPGESGNFITSGGVNEILGGEYGVPNTTINLRNGEEIKISGMGSVTFSAL